MFNTPGDLLNFSLTAATATAVATFLFFFVNEIQFTNALSLFVCKFTQLRILHAYFDRD